MIGQLWRRVGQAAGLAGMALLGWIDVTYQNLFPVAGNAGLWVFALQVAVAVAAAAVWLPARRPGRRRLLAAGVVVAASLLLSAGRITLAHTGGWDGRVALGGGTLWPLAESAGLLGVVFLLARWAKPVVAPVGVIGAGLAVVALPFQLPDAPATFFAMVYLGFVAIAAAVGVYLRMMETARDRRIAEARAEQQAEFARDLHDFVAHHVTGIVVQAQGAQYVAGQDPDRAVAALAEIERAGTEAMTVMRRMVGALRGQDDPAPRAPLGGLTDLPELLDSFATTGPTQARLHTAGELDDLPMEVTSSAYRVVMEALTNVRRHAGPAQRVEVTVERTADWLLVRITDDGAGGPDGRTDRGGFGLTGLAERVGALGGRLRAGPGIDGGWVVDMAMPATGSMPR